MAMIHVARDGVKLGEFTFEQIREGLSSGQFRAADLGWQSGMTEWRPLSELVVPAGSEQTPALLPRATATGLPWEHRNEIGFFQAFLQTVSLLITRPGEAFTMMRPEGGLADPLLFGVIGGCVAQVVSLV